MKLTKIAIFCLVLALVISIVSCRKPNKVKRKRGKKHKTTKKTFNITTTTATPSSIDNVTTTTSATILRSTRAIPQNASQDEDFEIYKEKWQPPMDTRCCYFMHPCPVMRVVHNVKRVFSPHFWKRGYHYIFKGKDIGACDPDLCKCYSDTEKHACVTNDGFKCPCYEQYVARTKNEKKA
ncbi:hypothetical protein WDU94_008551 [Cyamophila willieti]